MQPPRIARRREIENEYRATHICTQASGASGYRRTALYLRSGPD